LVQAPFDVRAQSTSEILVRGRNIEPFWIKVATAPPNGFGVFQIFAVGDDLQEPLISRHATNIFGRPRPRARDAAPMFGRRSERQEFLDRNGVPLAIPEIIVVIKDGALLEVQQANLPLIEHPRIVIGRILRQELNVSIPQTTNAELVEMVVPPVERGLNSEMQMLQIPMNWQNQMAPDAWLDLVDGNSDLHSVCGFEHCPNEQGWSSIVKMVARAACEHFCGVIHVIQIETRQDCFVAAALMRLANSLPPVADAGGIELSAQPVQKP
jgi:hypothetical protein